MKVSIGLMLMILLVPAAVMAGPILEMPSKSIVLEQAFDQGEEARAVFRVCNQGDSELKILQVSSGCGCVTSNYDRSIPPAGEGRIEFVIETEGLKGRVGKRALIKTNDPQHAVFMIEMVINVLAGDN